MKGKFLLWLKGSVRIHITGSFCERFLNLCAYHGISLWNLWPSSEDGYEASLSLSGFRRLRPLVRKCHIRLKVRGRSGLPFFLFRYRKRKMLFASTLFAVALLTGLSFFIWDIEINGNRFVTDERIMDYLGSEGIRQGILKNSLDYKQLAARLRQVFPEMTWVSVKLQGTRLMIDLQENTDTEILEDVEYGPSSLIADRSGTVVKIITRAGTPFVKAGDEIEENDLLVSGVIDLVNDSAEVYDYQYVAADADIFLLSESEYKDSISLTQEQKVYSGEEKTRSLLRFGSLRIGIPFFGDSYQEYDCVTDTRQLRLMENFYLPIYFSGITLREYTTEEKTLTQKEAEMLIKSRLEKFLEKIQEKGVQIFQNNVKIETTDSMCTASGSLKLIEKAGKRVETEIIDSRKKEPPQNEYG